MIELLIEISDKIRAIKGWSKPFYQTEERIISSFNTSIHYCKDRFSLKSNDLFIEFFQDSKKITIQRFNWSLNTYGDWENLDLSEVMPALEELKQGLDRLIKEQIRIGKI